MNEIVKRGYLDYWAGKKEHNNPYVEGCRKHRDWLEGFESAKEEDKGED